MVTSSDLLEQFAWELRRAFRDLASVADQNLEPLGISVGDRAFLEFLAREEAPVSLSDLARKHSVSRQHIHQALGRLPNPAWVESSRDGGDGRVILLRLTSEGRRFWQRVRQRDEALLDILSGRLKAQELETSLSFLKQFRKVLRDISAMDGSH